MKLILSQIAPLSKNVQIESWLRSSLDSLLPLMRIDEARVSLVYVHEASPPYRATAHLVVPGPDLRAEVSDHTPRTAVAKLLAHLRAQVVERASKRVKKSVGRGRLPVHFHA